MWWRRGVLLDSLNYLVEQELSSTLCKNKVFNSRKWNWFEKNAISYSKRPFLELSKLVFSLFGTALAIFLWKELLIELLRPNKQELLSFDKYLAEILTSQLTLIGLVYPIIVGLVAFFLQRQTGSRPMWVVFERYSAFRFVGINGLFLSLVIVLSYFFKPFVNHQLIDIFTIAVLLWFVFNLISALWFLYSIFNLVDSTTRSEITIRYIVNEVMPSEITAARKDSHLLQFVENLAAAKKISSRFELTAFSYSEQKMSSKLVASKTDLSRLDNVYFFPLSVLMLIWAYISRSEKKQLLIPINTKYQAKEFVLLRSNVGIPKLVQFLFRLCFRFKKTDPAKSSFQYFLSAELAPLIDAFEEGKDHEIETEMKEFLNRFRYLVEAMDFEYEGEKKNWLLLDSGFSNSPITATLEELYQLSQFCIDQLSTSVRPFYRSLFWSSPTGHFSKVNFILNWRHIFV